MHNKFRPSSDFRPSVCSSGRFLNPLRSTHSISLSLSLVFLLRRQPTEANVFTPGTKADILYSRRRRHCRRCRHCRCRCRRTPRRKKSRARLTTVRPQDNECHSAIHLYGATSGYLLLRLLSAYTSSFPRSVVVVVVVVVLILSFVLSVSYSNPNRHFQRIARAFALRQSYTLGSVVVLSATMCECVLARIYVYKSL